MAPFLTIILLLCSFFFFLFPPPRYTSCSFFWAGCPYYHFTSDVVFAAIHFVFIIEYTNCYCSIICLEWILPILVSFVVHPLIHAASRQTYSWMRWIVRIIDGTVHFYPNMPRLIVLVFGYDIFQDISSERAMLHLLEHEFLVRKIKV